MFVQTVCECISNWVSLNPYMNLCFLFCFVFDFVHTGYTIPEAVENLLPSLPSLLNTSMSTLDNSQTVCDVAEGARVNCDSASECDSTLVDSNGPVCCSGSWGCRIALNMTAGVGQQNVSIRCDGHDSCTGIPNVRVVNNETGDIFYSGTWSGRNATVISTKGNIFCTGYFSCSSGTIEDGDYVYCTAYLACHSAQITNVNGIFGYGVWSLLLAKIAGANNVYCDGTWACANAIVTQLNGNVYGNGYQPLKRANISHVEGYVIGVGYGAILQATVNNVSSVG